MKKMIKDFFDDVKNGASNIIDITSKRPVITCLVSSCILMISTILHVALVGHVYTWGVYREWMALAEVSGLAAFVGWLNTASFIVSKRKQ